MDDLRGAGADPAAAGPPQAGSLAAVRRDASWDDWDEPPRARGTPELHLEGYDGPLDVLLDLAERQRIDLGRLSILALVEQFVAAMEQLAAPTPRVPVERRAEWLILAAQLLLLRSRLLFPANPQAAAAVQRAAASAAERLAGMQLIRAAATWLDSRPQLGRDVFARPPRGPNPRVVSYMALVEACLTELQGREASPAVQQPSYLPARAEVFTIQAALARLRAGLATLTGAAPLETFLPRLPERTRDRELVARSAVGSTFLASLELERAGEAVLQQDKPFDTVVILADGLNNQLHG